MSRRFLPSNRTSPSVTVKASRPARTPARVLLPEPLGPMMACTSPAFTLRSTPRRISLSSTRAWRLKIVSIQLSFFIWFASLESPAPCNRPDRYGTRRPTGQLSRSRERHTGKLWSPDLLARAGRFHWQLCLRPADLEHLSIGRKLVLSRGQP